MVVILIFLITFFSSSRATLTATTTSSHVKARIGSDVLLNCQFNTGQSQIDLKLLAVSWFLGHERVATYDDKLTIYRPSVTMSVDELQNGNASLLIKGTKVTDEGTYICKVIYTPERDQSQLTLSTEAPPTVNILSQAVVKNEHSFLRASAVGFYPKQITVLWFRDGKSMNNPTFQKSEMNDDGTFNINSYLTFVPTDSDSKITFSCRVIHTSLPEPIQRDFQLIFGVSPKVKIHSSPFVKNVEQTLKCEVTGFYPETIALNWLKNGQRVDRKNTNKDGTYNVEGYYSFTPNEEDEGSEISCEVQHETLQQPFSQKIEVKVISKPDAGLNTALIVGLVLCFLLLLLICVIAGALVYKRKNVKISEIQGPNTWVLGQAVSLACSIICPVAMTIRTKWIVEKNGFSSSTDAEDVEEEMNQLTPLDSPKFAKKETQLTHLKTTICISTITFEPSREENGAVFKCRVTLTPGKSYTDKTFKDFVIVDSL